MQATLTHYFQLMRLNKPIGILLLLWPTLWALWIAAQGMPSIKILTIFTLGVILMRSAGCVINDFADRHIDGAVQRTQHRPLATKAIKPSAALLLFMFLAGVSFLLVLQLNLYTILLACVAVVLGAIYPFMKRYTHLPQFVLGIAWYVGMLMAFTAVNNTIPPVAWLLYLAAILWTVAYDTMYAMVDREDDLKIGVKSTAILFAHYDKLIIGLLQILTLGLLSAVGWELQLGKIYYASLVVAGVLFIYQQYLIKDRHRDGCFKAFLNNNWVGIAIFVALFLTFW